MDHNSTDGSLLHRLRGQTPTPETWRTFDAIYRDLIYVWCRRKVPHEAAEDLTQEIMLKLTLQLPKYEYDPNRGRFRSWLKTVVSNALRDYFRSQDRRNQARALGGDFDDWIAQQPDLRPDPGPVPDSALPTAASLAVERTKRRVSSQSWAVFFDLAFVGLPATDVATKFGLNMQAVYKVKYRVSKRLRHEYEALMSPLERID